MWSQWQPDRQVFFNSHFITSEGGNLIVDPLPLEETDAADIEAAGGVALVVITNRDHERAAAAAAQRFGARIAASRNDAPLLSLVPDLLLGRGDRVSDASVIELAGMKSPGEIALAFSERRTILVGDALWGAPAGALSLPPRVDDVAAALLSLRQLAARRPMHLLVGDGQPIFERAYSEIHAFLASRNEVYVNRINVDELAFVQGGEPPEYESGDAEIGQCIGASKLGYRMAEIPPGKTFCPMHWHTMDEELFIVWQGEPSLVTPRGEIALRRGDFIAFPNNESGAHKVVNRSASSCSVIMIAYEPGDDVCFYPDSRKLLVSPAGVMVRSTPELEYYDGER